MNRAARRRPSPTTIIALLALFAALGGTAIAAGKLSGAKIRRGSIPGSRLKKDTLTGKQVKESTLGTVPAAETANQLAGLTRFDFKLGFGESKTFLTAGPFSFTARCLQNTDSGDDPPQPNKDVARIVIATNADGMVFDGFDDKRGEEPTDFLDTTTPESERVFTEEWVDTGESQYDASSNEDGAAYQPGGIAVSFDQDGLGIGVNVFGPGCFFHGYATVEG